MTDPFATRRRLGRPRKIPEPEAVTPVATPAPARSPERHALDLALTDYRTPCADDDRFLQDRIPHDTGQALSALCSKCRARPACAAYATTEGPKAGYWAGTPYGDSRRPGTKQR